MTHASAFCGERRYSAYDWYDFYDWYSWYDWYRYAGSHGWIGTSKLQKRRTIWFLPFQSICLSNRCVFVVPAHSWYSGATYDYYGASNKFTPGYADYYYYYW